MLTPGCVIPTPQARWLAAKSAVKAQIASKLQFCETVAAEYAQSQRIAEARGVGTTRGAPIGTHISHVLTHFRRFCSNIPSKP